MLQDEQEALGNGSKSRIHYIDFMIDVQVGRRRNIMDNLAAALDNLDTADWRKVSARVVEPIVKDLVPIELQSDLWTKIERGQDDHGLISTVDILEWVSKGVSRQQRETVRSIPESELSGDDSAVVVEA